MKKSLFKNIFFNEKIFKMEMLKEIYEDIFKEENTHLKKGFYYTGLILLLFLTGVFIIILRKKSPESHASPVMRQPRYYNPPPYRRKISPVKRRSPPKKEIKIERRPVYRISNLMD